MKNPFVKKQDRSTFYRKLFVTIAAGLCLLALSLIQFFLPFRTLVPKAELRAREEGELRLHFLSIGQGDCTLVEFPDGELLVVDAGDGDFEHIEELYSYIKAIAPTKISLFVTHADVDHYGGFFGILDDFSVEKIYLPPLVSNTNRYQKLLDKIDASGAETHTMSRYSLISNPSGAQIGCISPYSQGETDDNDASCVLYLSYGGVNVLLGSDISAEREALLMREYALYEGMFDCGSLRVRLEETDILKVSHHGSKYSSSEEWLNLLGTEVAVLSCGRGNAYFHPAADAVKRLAASGAEIYRTDELGSVTVSILNGTYTVYTGLE